VDDEKRSTFNDPEKILIKKSVASLSGIEGSALSIVLDMLGHLTQQGNSTYKK